MSGLLSLIKNVLRQHRTYKGSKIEWDIDECAAVLDRPLQYRKENQPAKKKQEALLMNRFHLLNMDDTEDGSLEDDNHDTSGITLPTGLSTSSVGLVV